MWSSWPWVGTIATTSSSRSRIAVKSGRITSMPGWCSSGKRTPMSTISSLPACSNTVMLRPISPRPSRAITRRPPGASGGGVRSSGWAWLIPRTLRRGSDGPSRRSGTGPGQDPPPHRRVADDAAPPDEVVEVGAVHAGQPGRDPGELSDPGLREGQRIGQFVVRDRRPDAPVGAGVVAAAVALDEHALAQAAHLVVDDAGDA